MFDRNNNVYRMFSLYCPNYSDFVYDQEYLGDFETLFFLEDGDKILFDELNKKWKLISPSPDKTELTDDEWIAEFSRKLKKKLSLKHMTQKELGELIGVSTFAVSRYVNGIQTPPILILRKIASVLNCSVEELINFDYLL